MFKYSLLAENLKVQLSHLYYTCLCDKKTQSPLTICSSSAVAFSMLNYNGSCYLDASCLNLSSSRAMNYSVYQRASPMFNGMNKMNGLRIKVILAFQSKRKNQALSNRKKSGRDVVFYNTVYIQ